MSRDYDTVPHVPVHVTQEVGTGLMTQDAKSTKATVAFDVDKATIFGHEILVVLKHKATADQAVASAGAVVDPLGTKQARNEKYRIVRIETIVRSLRTGGTPDHDWKLTHGDGAASESFTDIVASADVDSDSTTVPVNRAVAIAQAVLLTGETLRSDFAVSGSTTTGTSEFDVYIWLVPVN